MYCPDDPTLALIARFVGGTAQAEMADSEFLSRQVAAIEQYIGRFPAQEREARAIEWIEANAASYRQQSLRQAAVESLKHSRCPDCPLSGGDERAPCSIHAAWLALLQRYAANELSSNEYVEQSLTLLDAHKNRLKVSRCREPLPAARPALSCPA